MQPMKNGFNMIKMYNSTHVVLIVEEVLKNQ
jgi:hypothetical protein